jgi:WD40 repeat protein
VDEAKRDSTDRRLQVSWNKGDVFAGVGGGNYNVFSNDGVLKGTISTGLGGETTGCAFTVVKKDKSKLYTTVFQSAKVVVFDVANNHTILQTIDTSPGSGTESIVFDAAGNFYVGHANGDRKLRKYNASGGLLETYAPATDHRGTDWIDLARDQCTLFYTSEGRLVKRFDVCTNTQLPDFATLPGIGYAFALRLLPPGDGTRGLLVADTYDIKRLDKSGNVVRTYNVTGEGYWFSLNLDIDGKSFWSGGYNSLNIYRFDIDSGRSVIGPIPTLGESLSGICLLGEVTAVIRRPCGKFGLSIFCPLTLCGIIGRFLGLCKS